MSVLKLHDANTGESSMDIVEVPEGLSLQITFAFRRADRELPTLILDRQGEDELFNFLARRRPKPMEFHY